MREPRSGAYFPVAASEDSGPRYVRESRLGQGGMGSVWRATDTRLRRTVALKSVTPDASDEVRQRLIQEARLAGHLNHPGVVRVLDQGIDESGKPFYVMELLSFPLLGRGRDRDLHAMVEIARTVGFAHREGLVHRDLKPSNLGLRGDQPVVADWGLARPYGHEEHWTETVLQSGGAKTRTGVAMGTVGYLAPEQMTGGVPDPRSDVWSLGAIIHEVVAKRTPYAEDGTHRLLSEVVSGERLLHGDPVGDVVRKALAIKPEHRYADGIALAEALAAALPTPAPRPARPQWLLLAATAVICGLGASLLTRPSPPDHASTAALALGEHAWTLYRDGYTLDALDKVQRADGIASTAWSRGLQTARLHSDTTPLPTPPACEELRLDPSGDSRLCLRSGAVALYAADGSLRWERRVDGVLRAEIRDGITRFRTRQGWEEIGLGGETLARFSVNVEDYARAGERTYTRAGWGVEGTDLTDVLGFGPHTDAGVLAAVRHARTLVLRDDGSIQEGPSFAEPVTGWKADVDGITVVGLRGQVLRLGPDFREIERYQLTGATQVLDAAIGIHDEIAVSTEDGVVIYQHHVPMMQATRSRVDSLTFGNDGVLVFFDGRDLLRLEPGRRHLGHGTGGSVTAIEAGGPRLLVGSDLGVASLDAVNMTGKFEELPIQGPFRQFVRLSTTKLMVGPGSTWDQATGEALAYSAAVGLEDDSAILLKRHEVHLARRVEGKTLLLEPAPVALTRIDPTRDRRGILGLSTDGSLWRGEWQDTRLSWTDTGFDDVRRVAESAHGLLLGRDTTLFLEDAWSHDLGSAVSAVAASEDWLVAGTLAGEIWVFSPAGELLARMPAHTERVSALHLDHDQLYSGSWAPGLRRWELGSLR